METYLDPEEKIQCPYNNAHYILRKRMNTHLVKCKRNYPDARLVECDFNVNHKIPEPELQYHHENCEDRPKIEMKIYQEEGQDLNKYPIYNPDIPTEESWDDYNCPTYDPSANIENREIIRGIDVESAAKRRDFRNMERKRLARLRAEKGDIQKENNGRLNERLARNYERVGISSSVQVVSENLPDSVAEIVNRIKSDSKAAFIPKVKKN